MSTPYNEALGATLIERTKREQIVLVGVTFAGHSDEETEASLDELSLLIDTAGADEAARIVQRRDAPDHTWFIGKGKLDELKSVCLAVDADTVVFDNELSPAQQFNLEKLLGRTAIDRTAVILDIFAQNAHTLEGKAQVELALLRYRLPRLRRGAPARLS
ncbi:MAG TPA: GTPase HflX, partial [Ilumatobacteraceae bacterium]|nr:GTPase HflX [Ilumatobacteraceae bacterium]